MHEARERTYAKGYASHQEDEDEDTGDQDSFRFYNDRRSTFTTPSTDSLSSTRSRSITGGSRKSSFLLTTLTKTEKGKWEMLMDQTLLAAFFEGDNGKGKPLRTDEWPAVITMLYEKIFKRPADTMPDGSLAAVWLSIISI